MDLTKDEIEYLARRVWEDKLMWEHDLKMHREYEAAGLRCLSEKELVRTESALKALNLLERKLKAQLDSMEDK